MPRKQLSLPNTGMWSTRSIPASWIRDRIRSHLLLAPPFVDCPEDRIWGITPYKHETFLCRNRPRLMTTLVQALQRYFDTAEMMKEVPSPEQLQQIGPHALWNVIQLLWSYPRLRTSRRLSTEARAHIPSIHESTLMKYATFLLQLRDGLTPADYAAIARDLLPSHVQDALEDTMEQALTRDGPPVQRRAFSDTARYYAIAEILRHFAIEHRKVETVVARLRKTVQRRTSRRR
jgi:hypothetical protein